MKEESFEKYFSELRRLAKTCGYGQIEDSLLRDKIIIGIQCEETKKKKKKAPANTKPYTAKSN